MFNNNNESKIFENMELTPSEKGIIFALKWSIKKNEQSFLMQIFLGIVAGMIIGFGFIACFAVTSNVESIGIKNLISSCLFSGVIILITYVGGGLYTSHLVATIATIKKCINFKTLIKGMTGVLIGNFLGTGLVAFICEAAGVLTQSDGTLTNIGVNAMAAAKSKLYLLSNEILTNTITFKTTFITIIFVFFSGILCNMLVSTTLQGTGSANSDFGKIFLMFILIIYFFASGFQHGPANSFIFWICIIETLNKATFEINNIQYQISYMYALYFLSINILFALLGNWVGGGLIAPGLIYLINKKKTDIYLDWYKENKYKNNK